jgi:hypothetical protein
MAAQLVGGLAATLVFRWLLRGTSC